MDVIVRTTEYCTVVILKVDTLDVGTSVDAKRAVAARLDLGTRFVLDLSGVKFIDSSGIGAMLAIRRMCIGLGKRVKVSGMNEQVRVHFATVGMNRLIDLYDKVEQAVQAFADDHDRGEAEKLKS